MNCLFCFLLFSLAAASTPAPRLRGSTPSSDEQSRGLGGVSSNLPPLATSVVIDLQGMSASGFSCSILEFNVAPENIWAEPQCELGCGGQCGIITFVVEAQYLYLSTGPAETFMEGMEPLNYFPSWDYLENSPKELAFAAIMNLDIPLTNGTATGLSNLHIGYGNMATLDWWIGSASCMNHGKRDTLYCDNNLVFSSTCDEKYYTDDQLKSVFDTCVQLSAP